MAVLTLSDYLKKARESYDPSYNQRITDENNAANTQIQNYDNQKGTINQNYAEQADNAKINTLTSKNNFASNGLSRGIGRSSIVTTGLAGLDNSGNRLLNKIDTAKTNDLTNIENMKTIIKNNLQSKLTGMSADYETGIRNYADQLMKQDQDIDFRERQFAEQQKRADEEKTFRDQQLQAQLASAASRASSSNSQSSSKAQYTSALNGVWATYNDMFNNGTADQWLQNNGSKIIRDFGSDVYNDMVDRYKKYITDFYRNQRNNLQDQKDNQSEGYYVTKGGRMLIE